MTAAVSFLLAIVLAQSGATSQRPDAVPAPSPRELLIVAAAPVYLPDGSSSTEAVSLPAAGSGLVHVFSRKTLCGPASSGANEPTDAAYGWRIASRVITRSDTDVVLSVDWRRVWDGGRKIANGPGGTVQLTMHVGDRIPLDYIGNTTPTPACRAVGLGLEVLSARAAVPAPAPATSALPLGAVAGGAKAVNAELWLTQTSPADTRQEFHQVVRLSESGGRFSFAPTSVATSRGDVKVEISGTIDRFRSPAGGEFFVLSLNRVITGATLPAAGLSATTGTVVPMPGVDDVVAFELTGNVGGRAGGGGRGGGGGVVGARSNSPGPTTGGVMLGGAAGGAVAVGPTTSGASQGTTGGGAAGARAGAGGAGGGFGGARGGPATMVQMAALLEGHQFSLRLRVTSAE